MMEVVADQCMYGLRSATGRAGGTLPAKKPTKLLTNGWHIAQELNHRCDVMYTSHYLEDIAQRMRRYTQMVYAKQYAEVCLKRKDYDEGIVFR